jgi:hypothetical protein
VNSLAEALIADALAEDADELTAEQIAEVRRGIRCGLRAVTDGRERSVAALAAGGGVVGLGPVAAVTRLRSASEVTGR